MEKGYVQIAYAIPTNDPRTTIPKIAIVSVHAKDGQLISELAEIAKKKLYEKLGETVRMIDYTWLGHSVMIVD